MTYIERRLLSALTLTAWNFATSISSHHTTTAIVPWDDPNIYNVYVDFIEGVCVVCLGLYNEKEVLITVKWA